jgi:hypothetical protein
MDLSEVDSEVVAVRLTHWNHWAYDLARRLLSPPSVGRWTMDRIEVALPRRSRSRGFTPAAAATILVGVTVASAAGFLGLGHLLFPHPSPDPVSTPVADDFADDVLTLPASAPVRSIGAEPLEEPVAAGGPAASPPPAARPRPGPVGGGPTSAQTHAEQHTTRDGFGGDEEDPLGNLVFGEIEG